MKRLLLIGDPNSLYVHNYACKLRSNYGAALHMDIFANFIPRRATEAMPYDNVCGQLHADPSKKPGKLRSLSRPRRLFTFLKKHKNQYDVVHVLYCIQDLMVAGKPLRKVAPRLILTVFGSDFFQLSGWKKRLFRPVYQSADYITSNNSHALEEIRKAFPVNPGQLKLCRFGFSALDSLHKIEDIPQSVSQARFQIPAGKVVICIGYNYDSIQQHIPILNSIISNAELAKRKEEFLFLIPMTYGTEPAYRKELLQALFQFPFHYMTIEHFLSEEDNAHLRKAPDIMIQLQKTDSFSASTQEHLSAGNLVITGKWLPYSDLLEAGIYYRTVSRVEDIGSELLYCIDNIDTEKEKCKRNPEAIYRLSSWSANLPSWLELYE